MPSVKRNFIYSSFLTASNYIFPLITYPYISRVLGVTNIGLVNFVDSIIQWFVLISMLGISTLGIREISACGKDLRQRSRVFSSLLALNTISTLIALILLIICTLTIPKLSANAHLMGIGALKLIFNYLLIDWLYKGLENFKYITTRSLIVKLFYVLSIFIFVRSSDDVATYYFLTIITIIINAIINCIYSTKFVKWGIKYISFNGLLKPFFTLGVYMLLTSMYVTFNVTFLGFVCNDTQVGYYTTATKLFSIILAIFTAFTGVMLPRMSSLLTENKIDDFKILLSKSGKILTEVSIPIIVFSIIFAPEIVNLISGKGYEGAIIPMMIIMPLVFVIGYEQILVIQGLMPLKQESKILRNTIIAATTSLILNISIVPYLQAIGSAVVWVTSEIIIMVLSQIVIHKLIGYKIDLLSLFQALGYYTPLAILLIIICYLFGLNFPVTIIGVAITIVYFYIVNAVFIKDSLVIALINGLIGKYTKSRR